MSIPTARNPQNGSNVSQKKASWRCLDAHSPYEEENVCKD